jgi:heme-degrading monooxygenase HmoA
LLIFHPKLLSLPLKNSVPHDSRVVLFSLLRFSKGQRWRALQDFVWLRQILPKQRGAQFVKVMGCGKGAVFSVGPDWGRYAFLSIWNSEESAINAFQHPRWCRAQSGAESNLHLSLLPVSSHGKWDGGDPFQPTQPAAESSRTAVLTRADVKPWKIRSFSRHAATTSAAVENHEGLQFSLGMGEWPFVRQATFSIWDSKEAMKVYAYKNSTHIAAMRGKNKENWYGEELYARFTVLAESSRRVQDLLTSHRL